MPKKTPKLRHDANEIAYKTMLAATGQGEKPQPPGTGTKNPEAVARGHKGGLKGGGGRAKKLTADQRKKIARKAAVSRWQKQSH